MADVWELIENAPTQVAPVAELYHWSTNYEAGQGPFTLFLDMIGWSEDNIGEPLYGPVTSGRLGYVELDKLAAALMVYSESPQYVREFVDELMQAESNE